MIHPTAIIDPAAKLADDVEVGAFSVIGPDVEIGSGTVIKSHVVINGPTRIGKDNRIFQFASLGDEPQDKKYAGEATLLEIGDRNTIREYVTMNRGTVQDRGATSIGSDNWIMAYVHIAHDCVVGNNTIFANAASLAGHVRVDDNAILGGFSIVHQFCRIGTHSFSGMGSVILKDIPPYVMVSGSPCKPHGLNTEGLRRKGVDKDTIQAIKTAYKTLYKSGDLYNEAREKIAAAAEGVPELKLMSDFLFESERGIVR